MNRTQIQNYTIPHLVYTNTNPAEQNWDDFIAIQNTFLGLQPNIQDVLTSPKTGDIIQNIGNHFKLTLLQTAGIARMVRSYYFGELASAGFVNHLMQDPGVPMEVAREIATMVQRQIITVDPQTFTVKAAPPQPTNTEQLPLSEVLGQYPELGNTVITDIDLVLPGKSEPVRGTITNWLYDYRDALGSGTHGPMERGNYLFNAKNSKRLQTRDRQKLGTILKSLDEDTLLTIDPTAPAILLDTPQQTIPQTPVAPPQPASLQPFSNVAQNASPLPPAQPSRPAASPSDYYIPESSQKRPMPQKKEKPVPPSKNVVRLTQKQEPRPQGTINLSESAPQRPTQPSRPQAPTPTPAETPRFVQKNSEATKVPPQPVTPERGAIIDTDDDGLTFSSTQTLPVEQKGNGKDVRR